MKAPCDNPHGAFCWRGIQDCSSQSSVLLEGVKNPGLSFEGDNIEVGEYASIRAVFPLDATGNIELSIAGASLSHTISTSDDGGYYFDLTPVGLLPAGSYGFLVTYSGDAKYKRSFVSGSIEVTKVAYSISISVDNIQVGETAEITVDCPEDATGTLTVIVAGRYYTPPVKDGKAILAISGLEAGDYIVDATYSGDDKYESNSASYSFLVEEE